MRNLFWVVAASILLCACGGGGGGGGGSSAASAPPAPLTNFATVVVDAGPAALATGPNGYIADDTPYVSVTICAPGSTTNCQTIDHVLVDTGSVGLRLVQSVINPSLLSAMPVQTDTSSNPVGECYGFVDGYVFGSVRSADFQVGGESVSGMPLQVIADSGVFSATPPASCTSGGGTNINSVQALSANGIIGISVTTTDCGAFCETAGGFAAAIYYDCPTSGCSSVIARNAATSAPYQQLPNPVAAMAVDNNGTILELPSVPSSGEASATGTLYFGIGTQTNNGLGSATPVSVSTALTGQNEHGVGVAFTLYNAQTLFAGSNSAVPGVGANPNAISTFTAFPTSFDYGLPFFFGRNVYTALEGRTAGSTTGPYFAF